METTTGKEKSQDKTLLPNKYTVGIEESVKKALKQVEFKGHHSVNVIGSRGGSNYRSNVTCNMCGNKGHVQKYYRPKVTGSSGNPTNKYKNDLPEWFTKKHAVSDTKDLETSTMNRNNKSYKCCNYNNNGIGAWEFHWKGGPEEWKRLPEKRSINTNLRFKTNTL